MPLSGQKSHKSDQISQIGIKILKDLNRFERFLAKRLLNSLDKKDRSNEEASIHEVRERRVVMLQHQQTLLAGSDKGCEVIGTGSNNEEPI